MRIKPKKNFQIPKPKPKLKGKYPKAKKIKHAGKKFDVFLALLDTDAGSDSSHQSTKLYEEIQKLSKPQLNRLERKVQKVQNNLINKKKNNKKAQQRFSQVMRWIEDRQKYSQLHEDLLISQLKEKIHLYKIAYSAPTKQFSVKGDKYTFRRLSRHYLQEEIDQIEKDLENGMLLSPHSGHGAAGILKRLLIKILSSL